MKDLTLERGCDKYYWSPSMQWKKEGNKIFIEGMGYSGIATYVFPKLYFITQEGITIEGIFEGFSMIDEEQLNSFINKLIENKVLVNSVLPLKDVFKPLDKIFDNKYGDEIYYDVKSAEDFKNQQLRRQLPYDKSKSIKLKNEEEYPITLRNRSTCRAFNKKRKISLDKFSRIMEVFKQTIRDNEVHYYYASAGGLYPIDIYVYVKENRVENIDEGLYYYNPIDNSLGIVNKAEKIAKASYEYDNRPVFESSAFSLYFIYNADATMPKYGGNGYIFACEDVGIMVSTLAYISETQDIGLCSIGTLDFEDIRNIFKLNKNQIFIHAVEVGLKPGQESIEHKKESRNISSIKPTEKRKYYPLASPQKRMYFLNSFDKHSTNYNNLTIIELEGKINRSKIEEIFQRIVDRHETFRTKFEIVGEEPMQKIYDKVDFKVEYSEVKEEKEIEKKVKAFSRPFDLSKAPLLRVGLIRILENKHILMVDMHHIISDGVSVSILMKEFSSLYIGTELPELKIQYKDYAVWQRQGLKSHEIQKQEKYWLDIFGSDIPTLNMPTDFRRPSVQNFQGDSVDFKIDKIQKEKLHSLARENQTTLYMVLLTAYNILLSKYTDGEDIVIGSPIAGRQHLDLSNIVGMFVNILALRNHPKGEKTIKELLEEVKDTCLKAYDNQNYQYEELVDKLRIPRDTSRNPLFDAVFVLQNMDIKEVKLKDAKAVLSNKYRQKISKFDLTIYAMENNDEINLTIEYATSLFERNTIKRLGKHFIEILLYMVENPNSKLSKVKLLADEEKDMILYQFNDTEEKYLETKTIQELFEEQVKKQPNKMAVKYKDKRLTYKELNEKANQLSRVLRRKGVRQDTIVGIMLERSLEMMISIFGVLKAGGAYLPIDPTYPRDRIQYMLKDSEARILLSQEKYMKDIDTNIEIIDVCHTSIYDEKLNNLEKINTSKDLAYVIYTSGSTGKPKGVMIEHRALINRITWMQKKYPLGSEDIILQKTTFTFDVSVWELLWWSIYGGAVYLLEPNQEKEPDKILKAIENQGITIMHFVPSMLSAFLKYIEQKSIDNKSVKLRQVFTSGEALQINHVKEFYKYFSNVKLSNLYGPTEATIDVSYYDCENKEYLKSIPIGKPIDNIKLYILDKHKQLQPLGVIGELYIGGDGLGRGYLNKPKLTAERFVENPFIKGERMYKTGDLARWLPDGNIEYIGRIDHQVKIRGYRIELGEIENVLLKIDGIREATVLSRKDRTDMDYLCGYIVKEENIKIENIKEELRKELPDYMIPSVFIELNKIPITANGKINRKALLNMEATQNRERKYEGAKNEVEAKLVGLWEDILNLEKIGTNDDFFELGGHSLKATILSGRIQKELKNNISVRDIFECRNIKKLAKRIKESGIKYEEKLISLKMQESYPVSSAQKRIYAIQMMDKENTSYNIPFALELRGEIDRDRIEGAIEKLISKHEALRSSFHLDGEDIVQKIQQKAELNLKYSKAKDKSEIDRILASWIKPFDLQKAPLIMGGIIELIDRHILMLNMHHIISDGTTMGILVEDFIKAYEGAELKAEEVQYKEYAMWEKLQKKKGVWDSQREYWRKEYEGEIPVLELPMDGVRGSVEDNRGDTIHFEIDENIITRLKERMLDIGGTLYMGLMAGISILMFKYSGQDDIVIGMPIAGRRHPQLEKVAGMFVNTLAIRSYPEDEKPIENYLKETKQKLLGAYENQEYPYEELVELVGVKRDISRNPLFDVMLVLQNNEIKEMKLSEIEIKPYRMENNTAQFDITLSATEDENRLACQINYKSKLFKKSSIKAMIQHYIKVLEEIGKGKDLLIKDIELLNEQEKQQLIKQFNNIKPEYTSNETIVELFEKQVKEVPENVAVVYGEDKLTYKELSAKADQLACRLKEANLGAERIAAIIGEADISYIVGIMGILKAGGAYLPILPDYPKERIEFMLKDSNAFCLLKRADYKIEGYQGKILDIDKDIDVNDQEKTENIKKIKAQNAAYIIYTSGSTGKPKGVVVEHKNIANQIIGLMQDYGYGKIENQMLYSKPIFDVSIQHIFTALCSGATLHLMTDRLKDDYHKLYQYLKENKIGFIDMVPAQMEAMIEVLEKDYGDIRFVLGGEAFPPQLHKKLIESTKPDGIYNMYGPTETTINALIYKCKEEEKGRTIPIGKPMRNYSAYILSKYNHLQPMGIPGELCISGDGVARGYLNRSQLTQEKFVENPFEIGTKMYRTGDLARWMPDGNIEFLGRIDHQVKIRGYRIEPSEIENEILKYEGIKEAVVIAREDSYDDKYLVAYIVSDEEIDIFKLRGHLGNNLPQYMIPVHFEKLEEIPLTPTGKVDKRALPKPKESIDREIDYQGPRNEKEEVLVDIWQEVLSVKSKVGINDNFFEIGGDSIKAIQISARLQRYNLKLEVQKLFEYPTIKQLSCYVKDIKKIGEQGEVAGCVQLTPMQRWFFEKDMTDKHHWNQSVMLYKKEGFQGEIIKKAFYEIIKHHDALRMIYEENEEEIKQINKRIKDSLLSIEINDITEENYERVIEERAEKLQSNIDLSQGPLVKIGLFKTSIGDYLLIVIHHLVIDGVSWRIILEDLASAYEKLENGKTVDLPMKTTSFKEWSQRLNKYSRSEELLKEKEYWMELEKENVLPLPRDNEALENKVKDSNTTKIELSKEGTKNLLEKANRPYNTEINDILLAALGLSIKEWSKNNKVLIGLEGHGREGIIKDVDITRTVGWFTSEYPVILNIETTNDIGDIVKDVKETLRKIPNKGIGYGILKYITPQEYKEEMSFDLTPEISFNYLGQFDRDVNNNLFKIGDVSGGNQISINSERQHTLDISGFIADEKLSILVGYNRKEYQEENIINLIQKYKKNLQKIITHCIDKKETERTLSDFTSSDLEQATINKIFSKYNKGMISDIYSLSPMQEGMLFHYIMDKKSNAYIEQMTIDINGELDLSLVEYSFNRLIEKYDVLRTVFMYEEIEKPRQVLFRKRQAKVNFKDLSKIEEEKLDEAINKYKKLDIEKGFNLKKDIPMRISMMKINNSSYKLIWSSHHIIMDGWCLAILVSDFLDYYRSLGQGKDIQIKPITPYSEYIKWIDKKDKAEGQEYWKNYLEGYEEQMIVPTFLNSKTDKYIASEHSVKINRQITHKLNTIAKRNRVTINTIFETLWGILLSKYNNTNDVVFGSVVAGRSADIPDIENMVGLFINTVPIRLKYENKDSFIDLARKVQAKDNKSRKYDYIPLAEIQSTSELKQQLLNHILVFENYPIEEELFEEDNKEKLGFSIDGIDIFEQTNYDFNIIVAPGDSLNISFKYNSLMYDDESICRIGKHFIHVIHKLIQNEEIKICDLEIITAEEKEEILLTFNDTEMEYEKSKTLVELFEEQVDRTPNNISATYKDTQLTYRELNERVNKIANKLREKGVDNKKVVGIMVERSIEMIVGVLGILKSGAGCLPISIKYPMNRVEYMLKDSKAEYILTTDTWRKELEKIDDVREEQLIEIREEIKRDGNINNPEIINKTNDLLYLIYTSGTTGKPKGVMVGQRVINSLSSYCINETEINFKSRVLQYSSIGFDVAFEDIFCTMLSGGELCIADEESKVNVKKLLDLINTNNIETVHLPVALVKHIFSDESHANEFPKCVKHMIASGEQLVIPSLLKKHMKKNKLRIHNHYGPSETHVLTTYTQSYNGKITTLPPIGKPIGNTRVYILDKDDRMLPIGVFGQLCASGDSLGIGYLNKKALTDEKFVENPFEPGEKMYKTGDLARWLPNGNIEFLGRMDHQVKIRGYRIELREIEKVISKQKGIKEAVVLSRKDRFDMNYICAYIIKEDITISDLKEEIRKELPEYMVPSVFVEIDKIPLTTNGKIDRKALLQIESTVLRDREYEGVTNETEKRLVELWADILEIEGIGINDNFFDLGGHSLIATTLVFRIHKEFNVEVPVIEIFRKPTIKDVANYIINLQSNSLIKSNKNLIKLKEGKKENKNIFLVHAGSGEVGGYIEFCQGIDDDYSCWGIKLDGFEDCTPQNITIEKLAKKYIEVMKKVQENGPYYVAGWSLGGTITLEIAKKLEDSNEEIALVALVDSVPPKEELLSEQLELSVESEKRTIKKYIEDQRIEEKINNIHTIDELWILVIDYLEKTEYDVEDIKRMLNEDFGKAIPNFENLDIRQLIYYINVIRSLANARDKYIPNIKINTPIYYFEADSSSIKDKENWGQYSDSGIRYYKIKGDHYTVFQKPQVSEFAQSFNDLLKDVEKASNNQLLNF